MSRTKAKLLNPSKLQAMELSSLISGSRLRDDTMAHRFSNLVLAIDKEIRSLNLWDSWTRVLLLRHFGPPLVDLLTSYVEDVESTEAQLVIVNRRFVGMSIEGKFYDTFNGREVEELDDSGYNYWYLHLTALMGRIGIQQGSGNAPSVRNEPKPAPAGAG